MNSQLPDLQARLDRLKDEHHELPDRIRELARTDHDSEVLARLIARRDSLVVAIGLGEIDVLKAQIVEWESELADLRAEAGETKRLLDKAIQEAKDAQRRRDLAGRDNSNAQNRVRDMNLRINQERSRLAELRQQTDQDIGRLATGPTNTLRPRI